MSAATQSPHRADFWRPADGKAAECFLCGHRCRINNGKRGFCGVRENRDGVLYSLVYGRVIAEHLDPIEKKPLYHFLPGTTSYSIATPGCNFHCGFCQNWQISQARDNLDKFTRTYIAPEDIVERAVRTKCASISFTYTEPTIFMEYALDAARLGKQRGLKNVFVTNGYQTPEALEAMRGFIHAANVDLKSFSDDFYRTVCHGKLQTVLDSIRRMHEYGMHVEVTTLVIPAQNDSEDELRQIASFIAGVSKDIPWHISRFHPDYQAMDSIPTPISTIERAAEIGDREGLRFVFVGNVADTDRLNTRCPDCGKTIIQRSYMRVTFQKLADGKCGYCGASLPIVTA
ncbi:MAG: AmmeMemoRadiSam system radical SAM enzyme [Candidatus Abyssubacteria bacterium]